MLRPHGSLEEEAAIGRRRRQKRGGARAAHGDGAADRHYGAAPRATEAAAATAGERAGATDATGGASGGAGSAELGLANEPANRAVRVAGRGAWIPLGALPPATRADLYWALAVVGGAALVALLLSMVRGVAVPVLIAFSLAYLLDPLIDRFERRGWKRTTAILVLGGGIVTALATGIALLVPQLIRQAARLPDYFRELATVRLPRLIAQVEALAGVQLPHTVTELTQEAGTWASDLAGKVGPAAGEFVVRAAGGTAAAVGTVAGLLLVPVFLFYFLRDFDEIKQQAAELLPPRYRGQIGARFAEIDQVLSAFVRGQLTVAAVLAAVYATGLTLAGVKLGLVIGLVAGVASMIPVAGVITGVGLTAIAIGVDWNPDWIRPVVGAALTFGVGQALEGMVLTPRIIGDKVGLSAAVVMIAVLGFGEIFGFVGILLAVPMAAVLKVVLRVLLQRFRESQLFRAQG